MKYKESLVIMNKYAAFRNYLYPILINMDNTHQDLRREIISDLIGCVKLIYEAAHTDQVSRVRVLDARLATMRAHIRHTQSLSIQKYNKKQDKHYHKPVLMHKQATHAEVLLSEVGAMVYAWRCRHGDYQSKSKPTHNHVNDAPFDVML